MKRTAQERKELKEANELIKEYRKQINEANKVLKIAVKVGNDKLKIKEELLKKHTPEESDRLIDHYKFFFNE